LKREKGAQRHRRLLPDVIDKNGKLVEAGEERRLLAVAGPELQRLIIGALDSGCRRGELLSLQWRDVDLTTKKEIRIRAENAKTCKSRDIPISARLAAVLEMSRDGLFRTTTPSAPRNRW
jgi:Phage integrase family.